MYSFPIESSSASNSYSPLYYGPQLRKHSVHLGYSKVGELTKLVLQNPC